MKDEPDKTMEQIVARLGNSLSRASFPEAVSPPEITYRGHIIPAGFVWFCLNFTNHRGWPHTPAWPGLFSPLGIPSDLQRDNDKRRAIGGWPNNLVSFSLPMTESIVFGMASNHLPVSSMSTIGRIRLGRQQG